MPNKLKILILFVFVFLSGSFKPIKVKTEILNVRNLILKGGEPTNFILENLEKGDNITINWNMIDGKGKVTFTLKEGGQEKGKTIKSGQSIVIPNNGTYAIEAFSKKKTIIKCSINRTYKEKFGYMQLVRISNMNVGKEGKNNLIPIFKYKFQEGVKLKVNSSSLFKHIEEWKEYEGTADILFTEDDREHTLNFFWKGTGGISRDKFQGLRSVDNITFAVEIPPKPVAITTSDPTTPAPQTETGETTTTPEETGEDGVADLAEAMVGSTEMIIEYMKEQAEKAEERQQYNDSMMAALVLGQQVPDILPSLMGDTITMEIPPQLDYNNKTNGIKCFEIQAANSVFAYWFGVGEGVKKRYLDEEARALSGKYRSYLQKYVDVAEKGGTMRLPEIMDGDQIEYAIVDEINKKKFEQNLDYAPYRANMTQKYAASDYNFTKDLSGSEVLYFCACNKNRISPVTVFFANNFLSFLNTEQ